MSKNNSLSAPTRRNWWIDAGLAASALLAALSGIYFLLLPVGGYQGGRNPMYGVNVFFERSTWDDLHTWGGVVLLIGAVMHIAIHWCWIVKVTRNVLRSIGHTSVPPVTTISR